MSGKAHRCDVVTRVKEPAMHSINDLPILTTPERPMRPPEHTGPGRRAVGNTPLAWITAGDTPDGRGFWAKLEGANPGGIKDRAGLHMVRAARRRGDLVPGAPIVESTSGTLGLGLALAGISYGHPVNLVGDPGLEPQLCRLLTSHGARLDIVQAPHPEGGWQEARRIRVRELVEQLPGAWCPDQYDNPDNVSAYAPLAAELIAELPWVDALVCAVGTGGHSAGIHRVLRQSFPGVRLVGVDTVGSTIFGQPARPRLMRGLGSSIYPRNVDYGAFSEVHWVNAAEAVSMCRRLALRSYHSGGWSTGAVALVGDWIARTSPPDRTIVAVFPDGPWRYCDTVYNDDYCREHGLLDRPPAQDPEELSHPGEREVIRWTRCERVIDPLAVAPAGEGAA
jgi:cysteine synthase A